MLGITWRLDMDNRWLGKHTLFTGWRGPLMRALGGIPVDRSNAGRVVDEVVERVRLGEVFGLVVTPDGTRGGHTHWKSGFYRIARESGMPVTLGYVDLITMTTDSSPTPPAVAISTRRGPHSRLVTRLNTTGSAASGAHVGSSVRALASIHG